MENNIVPTGETTPTTFTPLTLKAICEDKVFDAKYLRQPHWMKDSRRFCFLDALPKTEIVTVWMYDMDKGERAPLIFADALKIKSETNSEAQTPIEPGEEAKAKEEATLVIHGYQWSPDETRLLLARLPRPHESEPDKALYIYTPETQTLECVAQTEREYRIVKWSPDGKSLGYVKADDLCLLDLETKTETRLTDTATSSLYNGRFGWVIEEELDLVDGWAWSPDGNWIAYCECDESAVPLVPLTRYETLHLEPEMQRYPKAGDPNPVARIGLISVQGRQGDRETRRQGEKETQSAIGNRQSQHPIPNTQYPTKWLDTGSDTDIYIAGFQWTPDNQLLVQQIPRLQNKLDLLRFDPSTGQSTTLLTETDAAWVDARGTITFVGDTGEWLWPSDRDGYNHLYLYGRDGNLLRQLTRGAWDVNSLLGVDAELRTIFFSAARHGVQTREVWSVALDGGEPAQIWPCRGSQGALFSPDGKRMLNTVSSRSQPPQTDLRQADGTLVAPILDNPLPQLEPFRPGLGKWAVTPIKLDNDMMLNALLLWPPHLEPERKYPVLMYTYGGPNSQVALDMWNSRLGLEHLLSQQGYILALVDGRGSGMRGRDFKKCTYLNLGQREVEDQIAAAKWLAALPYVDETRIGIWGWSYGGYMASLCLLRGADVFKTGVAVAPVTDWKLYDSIYTERYMRRPQDNPEGYASSGPLAHAEKLTGKFLLMHGLDDDNVHFQNAAQLAELWQKHNKPFQMMAYPGKHHGLEGVTRHWAQTFTDFILANL